MELLQSFFLVLMAALNVYGLGWSGFMAEEEYIKTIIHLVQMNISCSQSLPVT